MAVINDPLQKTQHALTINDCAIKPDWICEMTYGLGSHSMSPFLEVKVKRDCSEAIDFFNHQLKQYSGNSVLLLKDIKDKTIFLHMEFVIIRRSSSNDELVSFHMSGAIKKY